MSDQLADDLAIANDVFTWVFVVEMILKLMAMGWKCYWDEHWNKFDFVIVWLSFADWAASMMKFNENNGAILAFRMFRMLRIVRIAGRLPSLRLLISMVLDSLNDTFFLGILLMIFLFMFAILGQNLFGKEWHEIRDPAGEGTFDINFWWSFLLCFQLITGDGWNAVMTDVATIKPHAYCVYFIILLVLGSFLVLNLFCAILLSRIGDQTEEKWLEDDIKELALDFAHQEVEDLEAMKRLIRYLRNYRFAKMFKKKLLQWKMDRNRAEMIGKSFGVFKADSKLRNFCNNVVGTWWFGGLIDVAIFVSCIFMAMEDANHRGDHMFRVADYVFTILFLLEMIMKMIALGVTTEPWFTDVDWSEVDLATWSSEQCENLEDLCEDMVVLMKKEDPRRVLFDVHDNIVYKVLESDDGFRIVQFCKTEDMRLIFDEGEFVGAWILTEEYHRGYHWKEWSKAPRMRRPDVITVCKSLKLTNENHNAYMGSNWDRLDCFVVLVGLLGLIFEDFAAFRAMRAIRPLRLAIRIQQLKVVLSALVRSLPGMFHAIMFCLLFWFILAILGVKWFSEKLWYCRCIDKYDCDHDLLATIVDREQCEMYPNEFEWVNTQWHFDNIFDGVHTLFTVATLSSWSATMYKCVNYEGRDKQPIKKNHAWVGAYFVFVQIVCCFFSLNTIVSTVINNFHRIKSEKNGSAFLTERQSLWVKSKRLSSRITLKSVHQVPSSPSIQYTVYQIVEHKYFEPFIFASIVMNAAFMCMYHYDQDSTWDTVLQAADIFFVSLFLLEAFMKIYAWGKNGYLKESWNAFDLFIAISGIVSLFPYFPGIEVFQIMRIGRLVRLINDVESLRLLIYTLLYASPSLWNVGILIFVIIFMYGIIGMSLFGEESCGYEGLKEPEATDRCANEFKRVNFFNFGNSLGLLFRVATEDGWTDVYATFQIWLGDDSWIVTTYFVSFFTLGTMIVVNLFIAVVLDVYSDNASEQDELDDLDTVFAWRDAWKKQDPEANGTITAEQFLKTILETPEPCGLAEMIDVDEFKIAQYFYDLYLIAFIETNETRFDCCTLFKDCWRQLEKLWCEPEFNRVGLNDSEEEEEEESSSEVGVWMIEYESAVAALSLRILQKAGKLDVPISLDLDKDEKYIVDWYCTVRCANEAVLTRFQEHGNEEEQLATLRQQYKRENRSLSGELFIDIEMEKQINDVTELTTAQNTASNSQPTYPTNFPDINAQGTLHDGYEAVE